MARLPAWTWTRGLALLALAGLAAAVPAVAALAPAPHVAAAAHPAAAASHLAARATTLSWRVRELAPEGPHLRSAPQAVDAAARQDFALVHTAPGQYYRLERFPTAGGHPLRGPVLRGSQLRLASGFAWVYGPVYSGRDNQFTKAVLTQVSEQNLAVVRSWTLVPRRRGGDLDEVAVTQGPGRSVWVGVNRTLLRLDAGTGQVLRHRQLPARFWVSDLAAGPAARHLYVATDDFPGGGSVFENQGPSGRAEAPVGGRRLRRSVGGIALTAVPGGVFGSFQSGKYGVVRRLAQPGLHQQPVAGRIFRTSRAASMVYGGGALFLGHQDGTIGCTSPRGAVRRTTTLSALKGSGRLLAADPGRHVVYGIGRHGLIAITPPAGCWG